MRDPVMPSPVKTERNKTIDIMKALGIIYVVLGHTEITLIVRFLVLFHMPLFYFISGYLYDDKYISDPRDFIRSRVKGLYVPFLKYQVVFVLMHNLFCKLYIYSDKTAGTYGPVHPYSLMTTIKCFMFSLAFQPTERLLGTFWFLWVLFLANFLFFIIRYLLKKFIRIQSEIPMMFALVVFYLTGNLLVAFKIPMPPINIETSLFALMIVYLGFLYKKVEHKIPITLPVSVACVGALCLGAVYVFDSPEIFKAIYVKPFSYILFTLAGVYFTLYMARLFSRWRTELLVFIGKNSLHIMALHFLSFKVISLIQIQLYDLPIFKLADFPVLVPDNGWWVLYTVAGVAIPLALRKAYDIVRAYLLTIVVKSFRYSEDECQ